MTGCQSFPTQPTNPFPKVTENRLQTQHSTALKAESHSRCLAPKESQLCL